METEVEKDLPVDEVSIPFINPGMETLPQGSLAAQGFQRQKRRTPAAYDERLAC